MMNNSKRGIRIPLVIYDFLIFLIVDAILYVVYQGAGELNPTGVLIQSSIALIVIIGAGFLGMSPPQENGEWTASKWR